MGLNEERNAIIQANPHLIPVDFEPNSYASGDFCRTKQATIGARRVVICNTSMSPQDAYMIGASTVRALRHRIPEIEWDTSPPGAEFRERVPLRYRLHPGAELIRDDRQPSGQGLQWIRLFLATAAVWLGVEVIRWLNSIIPSIEKDGASVDEEPSPSPTGPEAKVQEVYLAFKREIDGNVHELERASMPLTRRAYTDWGRRIDELRDRILTANDSGTLDLERTRILLTGLHQELATEREIRKPAKRQRTKSQNE